MRFHFPCFALCSIEIHSDDERTEVSATLLGFWPTEEQALLASLGMERQNRAEHEANYSVVNGKWPNYPWSDPGYRAGRYEIVSLNNVQFDELRNLQRMIEDAAVLRVAGVGKAVA